MRAIKKVPYNFSFYKNFCIFALLKDVKLKI